MKKIFAFIIPFILLIALVGVLFNFGEYNFFRQVTKIGLIEFPNPFDQWGNLLKKLDSLRNDYVFSFVEPVYKDVKNVADFFENIGLFFNYLGSWFNTIVSSIVYISRAIWEFIQFIFFFLADVLLDIYDLFVAFLILIGFPLDYFMY